MKGFEPPQPFKTAALSAITFDADPIKFPSRAKLNAEIFDWQDGEEKAVLADLSLCKEVKVFATTRSQAAAK